MAGNPERLPRQTPTARVSGAVGLVCIHNTGRSQMAAGYLRHLGQGRIEVLSAGSAPADSINPAVRPIRDEIKAGVTALIAELVPAA